MLSLIFNILMGLMTLFMMLIGFSMMMAREAIGALVIVGCLIVLAIITS